MRIEEKIQKIKWKVVLKILVGFYEKLHLDIKISLLKNE
jgi:hypothetical protein